MENSSVNKIYLAVALGLSLAIPGEIAMASTRIENHIESTNMTESAPLNLINHTFARLETGLDDSVDSQRLTYRIHAAANEAGKPVDEALKSLLSNISGGEDESTVTDFKQLSDATGTDKAIKGFIQTASFDEEDDEISPRLTENFKGAVKASLARPDIKLFSAQIKEHTQNSRVLLIYDQETKDVVVLYLSDISVTAPELAEPLF